MGTQVDEKWVMDQYMELVNKNTDALNNLTNSVQRLTQNGILKGMEERIKSNMTIQLLTATIVILGVFIGVVIFWKG